MQGKFLGYTGVGPTAGKYDAGVNGEPDNVEYLKINEALKLREAAVKSGQAKELSELEKVVLADINLRTRGLIGVLLGGLAADLTFPAEDMEKWLERQRTMKSNQESGPMVLILNRFGESNPSHREWGIDWYIKPVSGAVPRNGQKKLEFDFQPRHTVKLMNYAAPHDLRIALSAGENLEVNYENKFPNQTSQIINETRDELGRFFLKPGLYLHSRGLLKKILKQQEFLKEDWTRRLGQTEEMLKKTNDTFLYQETLKGTAAQQIWEELSSLNESLAAAELPSIDNLEEYLQEIERKPESMAIFIKKMNLLQTALKNKLAALKDAALQRQQYPSKNMERAIYPVLSEEHLTFKIV